LKCSLEIAVEHTSTYLKKQVRTALCPTHLLEFDHALADQVDETYINVCGQWLYLFRAIDSRGRTVDFYLSQRRNAGAARRFLATALRVRRDWGPTVINTDRNPAYGEAIRKLKDAKVLDDSVDHRQVKYLNNQIEADHGRL
jgi:transposase, IS6 family